MNGLLRMLWVFSVLSILGFGGGKGIIPQMHTNVVDQNQWVTSAQFAQFYTIGKLVPGPTTIFAALIGLTAFGVVGAAVATIGMFVPSTALMIGMDTVWTRWKRADWKDTISHGLAPAIVGLVWSSVFTIGKGAVPPGGPAHWIAFGIAGVVTILMLRTKVSAPALILLSGATGMAVLR